MGEEKGIRSHPSSWVDYIAKKPKRVRKNGRCGVACILGKYEPKRSPRTQSWKGGDNTFLSLIEQGFLKRVW
jgi:hypothetical protein